MIAASFAVFRAISPQSYCSAATKIPEVISGLHTGSWPNTGGNSNLVPVVANGEVFVASQTQLKIFGIKPGQKK